MEITYREAKQNNVDIAIFAADIYQQDGEKYIDAPWSLENSYLPENDPFNSSDIKGYIFNITDPSPCNKLFKKEFKNIKSALFPSVYKQRGCLICVHGACCCR